MRRLPPGRQTKVEDIKNIRMHSSQTDYDGNGDIQQGIFYEVQGMQENLMKAMQAYATQVAGKGILYSPDAYPYFFVDPNGNGQLDDGEAISDNAFNAWTPRLAKAALQLPDIHQRPRRLRPRRQVHHRAAV